MSAKKRIINPHELEAMIDRLKKLKLTRMARAEVLDMRATEFFKHYGDTDNDIARRQIQRAKKWREHAERLRNFKSTDKRLNHFSHKLAELRTDTFPGMLPDASVSV